MLENIEELESNVRGYVRLFPTVFDVARGSELWDCNQRRFVDFFCGAGTLNYGHNNPRAKSALLEYIARDGIQHGLDKATKAKREFLEAFQRIILTPRRMEYKIQFTGPTGTNAVEAAVKLAKLATQRSHVIAFTGAYHGHSLGSLALTANRYYHSEHFGSRQNVTHFPFDGYCADMNSVELLAQMLEDPSSGIPLPAAIILETVQGEGGVNVASWQWLRAIEALCHKYGIMLIVDDIQVGNGRTGTFFSFEKAGITPDVICLSKSLGGGLPLSVVLVRPEFDCWQPGQHTGTFRGNNLAFVTARALLDYWQDDALSQHIDRSRSQIESWLCTLKSIYGPLGFKTRGRGLIHGIDVGSGELARSIINRAFELGLLIESSGAHDEVLKIMPALTSSPEIIAEGLDLLLTAIDAAVNQQDGAAPEVSLSQPIPQLDAPLPTVTEVLN